MMVAWLDGETVACGILHPLEQGVGEIKHLFVSKDHRQQGLARNILDELEQMAIKLHIPTIRLETGNLQPAAIKLYQTSGYRRIPAYGDYIGDPLSLCFEKHLDAGSE